MNFNEQLSILINHEPQLRLLIDMIQEFIVLKDGEGRWLVTNQQVLEAYGLQGEMYQGKTDLELAEVSPAFKDAFQFNVHTDELAWEKGSAIQVEKSFRGADGMLRTWEVVKTPFFHEDGTRSHLTIVSRNITERKENEKKLQASEMKYRLIAETMKDIILVLNADGSIQYASPSLEHILGHCSQDFIGKRADLFIHPDDSVAVVSRFKEIMKFRHVTKSKFQFRYRDRNGKYIWFEANCSCMLQENGELDYVIVAARDIMDQKRYEQRLETMAYYDYLTKIPNRRFCMRRIAKELEAAQHSNALLALMYIDLDHFKKINDTLGHETGDQLLIQFVTRIKRQLRMDDFIARIGGDEFLIILPRLSHSKEAAAIAERICEALQQSWYIGEHIIQTTSSIGIALHPADGLTAQQLITNADKALYQAKEKGRNQFAFFYK